MRSSNKHQYVGASPTTPGKAQGPDNHDTLHIAEVISWFFPPFCLVSLILAFFLTAGKDPVVFNIMEFSNSEYPAALPAGLIYGNIEKLAANTLEESRCDMMRKSDRLKPIERADKTSALSIQLYTP